MSEGPQAPRTKKPEVEATVRNVETEAACHNPDALVAVGKRSPGAR